MKIMIIVIYAYHKHLLLFVYTTEAFALKFLLVIIFTKVVFFLTVLKITDHLASYPQYQKYLRK